MYFVAIIDNYYYYIIIIYNYFRPAVRRAVNFLNVSIYVYLNIGPYPQCNNKRAIRKRNQLNDLAYKSAAAYVEHAFARPMLASY